LEKRKTYSEKCPVCGEIFIRLETRLFFFDELPPGAPVLAEVTPGKWAKVMERKPAKT